MAIIEMQKLRLSLHDKAVDVLNAIQKQGFVEFSEISEQKRKYLETKEKTTFEFDYVSNRLDFAVNFLSRYEKPGGKLERMFEGSKVRVTEEEMEEATRSFYFNDLVETAQNIEEKMNDDRAKMKALDEEAKILAGWENLDTRLALGTNTATTQTIFVVEKKTPAETLHEILLGKNTPHHIERVGEHTFTLICFTDERESVDNTLREYEFETITLPKRRGTPKEELERIRRAKAKVARKMEFREQYATGLTKHLPKLKMMSDSIFWKKQKHDVASGATRTKNVLVFEGWCPRKRFDELKNVIAEHTDLFALEPINLDEGEEPPVEIENRGFVKPFENVTRLYGLPGYNDVDPTVFLSGFFFIFFGLALTDVGYGIVLALVTAFIIKRYHVPDDLRSFLRLLMFGGIATAVIGAFFGGYFGIDMKYMPAWVQSIQQFDPIKDPIPVFYLSLALGAAQIMFGIALKIVREAKNNALVDGILDQGPWLAAFFSLILFGGNKLGYLGGAQTPYVWFIYASLFSLVLTQGRKEKNIIMKLLKGVLSLYNSVGFFSDILSYSRLLALGLATSALAFAVNLIAQMVKGTPFVGLLLMAMILVIGHLFNMVVNILGAFVHGARLQFVEFFGKFIIGTGKNFRPFKREERYVIVYK